VTLHPDLVPAGVSPAGAGESLYSRARSSLLALIEDGVFDVPTLEGSVSARNHYGGTAPDQVRAAIIRARQRLA